MPLPTRPITIGPFNLGVNNRLPDTRLVTKDGRFLRGSVNADINEAGTVKRRSGYALSIAGTDVHSLWSDLDGMHFYVDGATLYSLNPNLAKTSLRADMAHGRFTSFAKAGDSVYYSNGVQSGRIDSVGDHANGVPQLAAQPVVTAAAGGAFPAGKYLVCFTSVASNGEESGSTVPVQVDMPANGKLVISGIPACTLHTYMSALNGDMMFSVGPPTAQGAASTRTLAVPPALGGRCQTLLLAQMPAGTIVRYLNGRLLVVSGPVLFYSEPYALGLYNPAKNYIVMPANITMLEPCEAGFFIGADQIYWIADPIDGSTLKLVSPATAVPGTGGRSAPNSNDCFWMTSENGLAIGHEDGTVEFPQQDNVVVPTSRAGASLYRAADGLKHITTSLFGADHTVAEASSYMTAEIVRKESTPL